MVYRRIGLEYPPLAGTFSSYSQYISSITRRFYIVRDARGIFLHCLNQLKVKSEHALFIGDRLREDIQGAQNAGMKSIWINRTNETLTSEISKPNYEIHNLSELLEIIQ